MPEPSACNKISNQELTFVCAVVSKSATVAKPVNLVTALTTGIVLLWLTVVFVLVLFPAAAAAAVAFTTAHAQTVTCLVSSTAVTYLVNATETCS